MATAMVGSDLDMEDLDMEELEMEGRGWQSGN